MTLVEYAEKFIGRPYVWGGDGSGKFGGGFDCSGLVLEALKATGYIGNGQDLTAQGLHDALKKSGWVEVPLALMTAQDVLFWKCTSPEKSTGMVRVRPLGAREAPVAILRAPV